jgi:hypothetical protein
MEGCKHVRMKFVRRGHITSSKKKNKPRQSKLLLKGGHLRGKEVVRSPYILAALLSKEHTGTHMAYILNEATSCVYIVISIKFCCWP